MKISAPREDFCLSELSEKDLYEDPFSLFTRWWDDAVNAQVNMLDAAVLSTLGEDQHPDGRVIFIKDFDERGLVFFSNYLSVKGRQLALDPHASLTLFWPQLERQVRVRGEVQKTDRTDSEKYFNKRPRGAQIGAWASPQSAILSSRVELEQAFKELEAKFHNQEIPCPPHWGGFRLIPEYFEFWQGRKNRLHDRFAYRYVRSGQWTLVRLAP